MNHLRQFSTRKRYPKWDGDQISEIEEIEIVTKSHEICLLTFGTESCHCFKNSFGRILVSIYKIIISFAHPFQSQMLHRTGIFTYMCLKCMVNVGKYTSPMDPSWDLSASFVLEMCPVITSRGWRLSLAGGSRRRLENATFASQLFNSLPLKRKGKDHPPPTSILNIGNAKIFVCLHLLPVKCVRN